MKLFLKQQSKEWLAWRLGGVGSSDAPVIMGTVPSHWNVSTPRKLWQVKTGRALSGPQTPAMRRGIKLEAIARDWYEQKTGIEMVTDNVVHPEHDFIRASMDGINYGKNLAIEIKCPGPTDLRLAKGGHIPKKYIWQLVHQTMTTKVDCVDYVSFDGKTGVIIPFERDLKLEKQLIDEEFKFWACVVNDISPELMKRSAGMLNLKTEEILEIIEKSKKLGATFIKIDGLEVGFPASSPSDKEMTYEEVEKIEPRPSSIKSHQESFLPTRKNRAASHKKTDELSDCETCGAQKVEGNYGKPFCLACWREKKDSEKS